MPTVYPHLRSRLSPAILFLAITDVTGMVLLATGAMRFAHGAAPLLPDVSTSAVSTGASTTIGLLLMFWAAARILREVTKQVEQQPPGRGKQ